MFEDFTWWHVVPLFVATASTIGGLMPFWNAAYAIEEFGLPKRIAISKPAQSVMVISSARMSVIGLAMLIFYRQGQYDNVDLIMKLLGYVGLVDGYICWKEQVPNKAVFRAGSGIAIAAAGYWRFTAGN